MRIHPAANAMPQMRPDEFASLKADIEQRGLVAPIELYNGAVLDGRHRYRACKELDIEPTTVEVDLDGMTPIEYVWTTNGVRRHFTPGQRAAVAVQLLPELKKEAKKRQGTRTDIKEKIPECDQGQTRDHAAVLVGVNGRYVSDAEKLSTDAPDLFKQVHSGDMAMTKAKREAKNRQSAKKRSKPKKPDAANVEVLLADPPWKYDFAETDNRNIENQYPTATPAIIGTHLKEWGPGLAKKCVLFLWATAPKLREALQVMELWEFEYKTHAVWDKQRVGMGYWFRGQHELLLVGTRGKCSPPDPELRVPSMFRESRNNKHSKKPKCVYEAIEHMFPTESKFEMYQREPRKGWLGAGNEYASQ